MVSVILVACLAVFGVLVGVLLLLAGGYLWWRHKRSQLKFIEPNDLDEESPNAGIDPALLNLINSNSTFSNSQTQFGGGVAGGAAGGVIGAAGPLGAGAGAAGAKGGDSGGGVTATGVVGGIAGFSATNNLNRKINGFLNLKTPLMGG